MKKKWFSLWLFPAFVLFATVTVWLRLSVVDTTYAIHQLGREKSGLKQSLEEMEVKVTAARSPRKLGALAKARFELAPPTSIQRISLKKGKHTASR